VARQRHVPHDNLLSCQRGSRGLDRRRLLRLATSLRTQGLSEGFASRRRTGTACKGPVGFGARYGVARPGTEAPGGNYHLGIQRQIRRVTAGLDGYRFESRYATVILSYGSPENIWTSGWSWPGAWLKSTYRIVDNTKLGAKRQGYALRYNVDGGPFEFHAPYTNVQQIEAATITNASRVGFVEGFFLPQVGSSGTLGRIQRFAVWTAWHPALADISLDLRSMTRCIARRHVIIPKTASPKMCRSTF